MVPPLVLKEQRCIELLGDYTKICAHRFSSHGDREVQRNCVMSSMFAHLLLSLVNPAFVAQIREEVQL